MSLTEPISAVQSIVNDLLAELHAKGGCEKLGLTRESFAVILCEIGTKHGASSEPEIRTFFLSLRIDELALARACAAGNNSAWEIFLTRFREKLYLSRPAHCPRRLRRPRPRRHALRRPLRHQHARRPTDLETLVLHWSRITRRLAAHRPRPGIRQSLPSHQTPRQSRRRIRRRSPVPRT